MGIGETLRRALDKLVMREAGYQANTVFGNLQLFTGLESRIEGAHYRGYRRGRGKYRERRRLDNQRIRRIVRVWWQGWRV